MTDSKPSRYPLKTKRRPGYLTLHRDAISGLMDLPPHLFGTLTRLVASAEVSTGILRTSIRSLAEDMRIGKNTLNNHLHQLERARCIQFEPGENQHLQSRIIIEDWPWLVGLDLSAVPEVVTPPSSGGSTSGTPAGTAREKVGTPAGTPDGPPPADSPPLDTRDVLETSETRAQAPVPSEQDAPMELWALLANYQVINPGDPCPACTAPVTHESRICQRKTCWVEQAVIDAKAVASSA